jgi:sphingolipid delta-4 desaturase
MKVRAAPAAPADGVVISPASSGEDSSDDTTRTSSPHNGPGNDGDLQDKKGSSSSSSSTAFHPIRLKQHHISRQREILAKYPQIKDLYGPDVRLLPSMLGITAAQIALSVYASAHVQSWPAFCLLAYAVGGLLTHWLSLGNHELCHDLMCPWVPGNEMLGVVANLAQGIPSFISFKRYHADHHWFLNEANPKHIDPDVPTEWEARFFTTPLRKLVWVLLTPAFYSLRPLVVCPKEPGYKEALNAIVVVGFDLALGYYAGYRAVLFNLMSTLLGMGLHPVAGHIMSEHYNLYGDDDRQETYSYYGVLNYVTFNVGYHVEHHDFPKISGFRLPQVTATAPEYYRSQHPHYSWVKILRDFIVRDDIGPGRRIIREMTDLSSVVVAGAAASGATKKAL